MGDRRPRLSRFLLLGAAYWIVVVALLVAALQAWPGLQQSQAFFYGAIAAVAVGGFAVVGLFRPKS